ncbi:MAG: isoprenylcysteine carboxylmethyltransferase family protein [Planctomycetes bacterium]|nr:isoprenylcysteine carboxylmethyltransferase family protein [Planctomycetota bacterium]
MSPAQPNESQVRAVAWLFVFFALALSVGRALLFAIRHRKRPIAPPRGGRERIFGLLFAIASVGTFVICCLRILAPQYYEYTGPIRGWESDASLAIASILIIFGFGTALLSQSLMGDSWRIGVPDEKTRLVTGGIYRYVRNPIYSGFLLAEVGLIFLLPGAATLAIFLVTSFTIAEWVRVEEKQQLALHGQEYLDYCKSSGRFLPKLSRQRLPDRDRTPL